MAHIMSNTSTVVPFRAPSDESDKQADLVKLWENDPTSWMYQQLLRRHFDRVWGPHLSLVEFRLASFILTQTVEMGRSKWGFSYKKFEHGDTIAGGTLLSRSTIQRGLAGLNQRGAITIDNGADGNVLKITPNLYWKPEGGAPLAAKRKEAAAKRKPAKARPVSTLWPHPARAADPHPMLTEEHPPMLMEEHPPCSRESIIRDEGIESEVKETEALFTDDGRLRVQSVERGAEKIIVRHRQRATANGTALPLPAQKENPPVAPDPPWEALDQRKVLKPGAIEKTFRAAFEKAYPDTPYVIPSKWTVAELSKVKQAMLSKWALSKAEDVHDFIEWIVFNWDYLRNSEFGWMKQRPAPPAPEINFITRHHTHFVTAYNRDRQDAWIDSFTDRETRRFHELTAKQGKTPEEARMLIAESRAIGRIRTELDAERAKNASLLKKAQAAEKRAYRAQPIHPESETAKKQRAAELHKALGSPPPLAADAPIPDLMAALEEGFRHAEEERKKL